MSNKKAKKPQSAKKPKEPKKKGKVNNEEDKENDSDDKKEVKVEVARAETHHDEVDSKREKTEEKHSHSMSYGGCPFDGPPQHILEKNIKIDKNREITEAERKEIREAFKILDEDGDGKLTAVEMRTLLQSQFMVFTDQQVDDAVKELDEDGSGTIEFEEYRVRGV